MLWKALRKHAACGGKKSFSGGEAAYRASF
jgi:hypothetical protein